MMKMRRKKISRKGVDVGGSLLIIYFKSKEARVKYKEKKQSKGYKCLNHSSALS